MVRRRVAILIGSTTDGGATDGTGMDLSGTLESVDPAMAGYLEDAGIEIVLHPEAVNSRDCEGAMTMTHAHVDSRLLDALGPQIKVVSNYGVGVNHIDLDECRRRGIPVGNTPDVLSDATADMAWALLLACARRIPECDAMTRSEHFTEYENMLLLGSDVTGSTLGIVGMGRIGREVARRATGFRMTTLYCNRTRQPEAVEAEVRATYVPSLCEMVARCDYVVLTCPLTADTHHVINAEALRAMKPSGVLINVARGGVVDQDALLRALEASDGSGIRMAGLDVSTPEVPSHTEPRPAPPRLMTPSRVPHPCATRLTLMQWCVSYSLTVDSASAARPPAPRPQRRRLGATPWQCNSRHQTCDGRTGDPELVAWARRPAARGVLQRYGAGLRCRM
jgi:lactate dehydrogenase-like 2-hydroxyacid dehydrogenase